MATTDAVRAASVKSPVLRVLAVAALIAVGLALLVLGSVALLTNDAAGTTTVSKQSTTSVKAPAKDAAGTTTTTVDSTDTTTPGKGTIRSEAVAATLFGLGALLFLTGIFFGRIQEVTLPGGSGFKLTEEVQEKVGEKAAKKVRDDPELPEDPETAIAVYQAALQALLAAPPRPLPAEWYPLGGTSPGDDYLDRVVDDAARALHGPRHAGTAEPG